MLPEAEEFHPPATVAWLRALGALGLPVSAAVAYGAYECSAFAPMSPPAYWALAALLALAPLAVSGVLFGLASVAESSARTAWELWVRRRGEPQRPHAPARRA